MEVFSTKSGPIDNNIFVAFDNDSRYCAIVDAPFQCYEAVASFIAKNDLIVDYILITHSHWDHIGGLKELKDNYPNAKICVHKKDAHRLQEKYPELGWGAIKIDVVEPDILLIDNETIECENMKFKVLHTPGHSAGCVCYYEETSGSLFAGDTLFYMSIGRTDFPDSNYEQIINSINNRLMMLPDATKVYCGHNEDTTIGFERKNNPFIN